MSYSDEKTGIIITLMLFTGPSSRSWWLSCELGGLSGPQIGFDSHGCRKLGDCPFV